MYSHTHAVSERDFWRWQHKNEKKSHEKEIFFAARDDNIKSKFKSHKSFLFLFFSSLFNWRLFDDKIKRIRIEKKAKKNIFKPKNNLAMSSRCCCCWWCLDHEICLVRLFVAVFYNEIEDMRHEFIMSDLALHKR